MTQCMRCIVRGRVQGVYFRASTQNEARHLGLSGHARNLPDGTVEALFCGDPRSVKELQDWLWQGPPHAQVSEVVCDLVDLSAEDILNGFQTG